MLWKDWMSPMQTGTIHCVTEQLDSRSRLVTTFLRTNSTSSHKTVCNKYYLEYNGCILWETFKRISKGWKWVFGSKDKRSSSREWRIVADNTWKQHKRKTTCIFQPPLKEPWPGIEKCPNQNKKEIGVCYRRQAWVCRLLWTWISKNGCYKARVCWF